MAAAPRAVRVGEFLRRLALAPPAASAEEAMRLLANTLNQVEDELTDVPFDPDQWLSDGRLYPPQLDSARRVPGRPDVTRYRSLGHNTWIGANGAICIVELASDSIVLDKPGADGCRVEPS